jgi:choline-glycine betaine transporter
MRKVKKFSIFIIIPIFVGIFFFLVFGNLIILNEIDSSFLKMVGENYDEENLFRDFNERWLCNVSIFFSLKFLSNPIQLENYQQLSSYIFSLNKKKPPLRC